MKIEKILENSGANKLLKIGLNGKLYSRTDINDKNPLINKADEELIDKFRRAAKEIFKKLSNGENLDDIISLNLDGKDFNIEVNDVVKDREGLIKKFKINDSSVNYDFNTSFEFDNNGEIIEESMSFIQKDAIGLAGDYLDEYGSVEYLNQSTEYKNGNVLNQIQYLRNSNLDTPSKNIKRVISDGKMLSEIIIYGSSNTLNINYDDSGNIKDLSVVLYNGSSFDYDLNGTLRKKKILTHENTGRHFILYDDVGNFLKKVNSKEIGLKKQEYHTVTRYGEDGEKISVDKLADGEINNSINSIKDFLGNLVSKRKPKKPDVS